MSELMNDLFGAERGRLPSTAGPICGEIAQALRLTSADADPMLAGLFWWRFVRSSLYSETLLRLGVSRSARQVVVNHAEETRFDLLLLDPYFPNTVTGATVDRTQLLDALTTTGDPLIKDIAEGVSERLGGIVDPLTLIQTTDELAQSLQFGVAVAPVPEEEETCALTPAIGFTSPDGQAVATVGLTIFDTERNSYVVTTADHALSNGVKLLFHGLESPSVLHRHEPSDSCILMSDVDLPSGRRCVGAAGPLRGRPPAAYDEVFFDGAASGPTRTRTNTHYDLSILDLQLEEISRIYTDADTIKGDSGAALVDSADRVLGFAHRRSKFGALVQYSSWVWAELVCEAYKSHGILLDSPRTASKVG